jgi:hypothetical protein
VRIGLGAVFGLESENLTTSKFPCVPRITQSDNLIDLLANYSHLPTDWTPLYNHSLAAQAASIAHTFKQALHNSAQSTLGRQGWTPIAWLCLSHLYSKCTVSLYSVVVHYCAQRPNT